MTPEQFIRNHGVFRIEDLRHEELLLFALTFMDFFTQTSVHSLLSGAFGVPVDPCPKETDAGIIEAYKTGRSFCAAYTEAEGIKWNDDTDLGKPGYHITVEDRSQYLKDLEDKPGEPPIKKVYVASSWKNDYYTMVVEALLEAGFDVYDFRNPPHGGQGFHWTDIDEDASNWTFKQYKDGLMHPKAYRQFRADRDALYGADACVLVLPCGRSAHTEAGWMAGKGKRVVAYIPKLEEPELMYRLFYDVVDNLADLIRSLGGRKDEFTTEMHWEMMDGEMDREEFLAWAAYGAIERGATKAEALAKYNISEELYDQVMAREDAKIAALGNEPEEEETSDS